MTYLLSTKWQIMLSVVNVTELQTDEELHTVLGDGGDQNMTIDCKI